MHLQKMQPIFFCCQVDKYSTKGSFHNYVDIILPFLDHIPTSVGTVFLSWTWTKTGVFGSPLLVHIVIECPPSNYKFPASKNWFLYLHQHRFLKDIFTWLSILLRFKCGKTLLPNDKNPLLNSKIPQVTTLDKKNVAVFLRQQLAVSKSTDLIMKLIVATCENQGWELRIVTDRFFFLLFLYFSFFLS